MDNPIYLHHKMRKLDKNQPTLKAKYSYLMEVVKDFKYTSKEFKKTVIVPKGFLIDGASIPRTLWRLIGSPFIPEFLAAATVHDYLYKQGGTQKQRKIADGIFKEILILNKVNKVKAGTMYASLRAFGAIPFNKK